MPRGNLYPTVKVAERTKLSLHPTSTVGDYVIVLCGELKMKKGSQINALSLLEGRGKVTIGKNAVVGYQCLLVTSSDTLDGKHMNDASPEEERAIVTQDIEIGDEAYVGSKSILMPGVRIPEGAVVGAMSYVDNGVEIKPWSVGWGRPYEHKKERIRPV